MGKEQLEALIAVLQQQLSEGTANPLIGTWTVEYNKEKQVFYFGKCEFGGYCEERPTVVSVAGELIDRGGPLFAG